MQSHKALEVFNWDDLRYVISVAKTGSYFRAAVQSHTNASTVARHIRRLESVLGLKVFDRYAHGMQLTPAGKVLLGKAHEMEIVANTIGSNLSGFDTSPAGKVTVSVPEGIASFWLTPKIAAFCEMFPGIDVEVITNRETLNILAHEADVVIAPDRPVEPRLVAQRVTSVRFSFFASDRYFRRLGRPENQSDLHGHEFVDYVPHRASASISAVVAPIMSECRVRLVTNSSAAYLAAIQSGMGIGLLPRFYLSSFPDLIELEIEADCTSEIWVVSHEETNKSRRIRLFLDFIDQQFKQERTFWK